MRWKTLAMFLLVMGFTLGSLLIYVAAQPKDFVIPLGVPKSNNPNLEQKFIQGSLSLTGKEIKPVDKETLRLGDFKKYFVNYLSSRTKIYLTWEAVNPTNNGEILVSTESLSLESLKLLNSVKSVEFLFDKQQILIKTKPFLLLTVVFSLIFLGFTILAGSFIWKFR